MFINNLDQCSFMIHKTNYYDLESHDFSNKKTMNNFTGFQNLIQALMIQTRVARDVNSTIVELLTQLQENFDASQGVVTTEVSNPEDGNSCPRLLKILRLSRTLYVPNWSQFPKCPENQLKILIKLRVRTNKLNKLLSLLSLF